MTLFAPIDDTYVRKLQDELSDAWAQVDLLSHELEEANSEIGRHHETIRLLRHHLDETLTLIETGVLCRDDLDNDYLRVVSPAAVYVRPFRAFLNREVG